LLLSVTGSKAIVSVNKTEVTPYRTKKWGNLGDLGLRPEIALAARAAARVRARGNL
jgi:hypothetical protein